MTAPVTQTQSGTSGKNWTVRFILPSKYTFASLPKPGGNNVRTSDVPAMRRYEVIYDIKAAP